MSAGLSHTLAHWLLWPLQQHFRDNSKFQLLHGPLYPELFPEPLPLTCEPLSHTGPHTRGVNTLPGATPPMGHIRYWRNTLVLYQGTKFSGTLQKAAQSR